MVALERQVLCSIPLLIGLALPAVAFAQGEADVEAELDTEGEREWFFDFQAIEEYRFRYATQPSTARQVTRLSGGGGSVGAESDHDLRLFLAASLSEDSDHFYADTALGLWADVDGDVPEGDVSAFSSVNDWSSPYLWFDVYTLYAEYHSPGLLDVARGGRQVTEHGPLATFDGAAVQLRLAKPYLDVFAFGGRTVHFFEVERGLFEDWLASGGFVVRPIAELRLELDYRFLAEDTVHEDGAMDHTYGIAAWYRFDDWLRLKGFFRGISDQPAHAGGGTNLTWVDLELGLDLMARAQLVELRRFNERDDPYFAVLGASSPHVKVGADLWKSFTTEMGIYSIHGGWAGRLLTEDEPTRFNRDYGRGYLWLQAADIVVSGPFAGIIGELHYTHSGGGMDSDNLFTIGGSAGYESDLLRGELGTYYQRFKYDYYMDVREIEHVRTYFGELSYQALEWLRARLRYEYEQFDRDIHSVTLSLMQTF
jgi:hypothetical protein